MPEDSRFTWRFFFLCLEGLISFVEVTIKKTSSLYAEFFMYTGYLSFLGQILSTGCLLM